MEPRSGHSAASADLGARATSTMPAWELQQSGDYERIQAGWN